MISKLKELGSKYIFDLLASKQIRLAILAAAVGLLGKLNIVLTPEQAEPVYMAILAALGGLAIKDLGKEKARIETEGYQREHANELAAAYKEVRTLQSQLKAATSKGKK